MPIDVNAIYAEIDKMDTTLEEQAGINIHYHQRIIVECDRSRVYLRKMWAKVRQELGGLETQRLALSETIENKKRNQITNNDELKAKYRTGKEREMAIEYMLKEEFAELRRLDNQIMLLKNLEGALKTYYSDVSNRQQNAKDQWRMMLDIAKSANIAPPEDKDVAELTKVIGHLEATRQKELEEEITIEQVEDSSETIDSDVSHDESVLGAIENPQRTDSHDEDISVELDAVSDITDVSGTISEDPMGTEEESATSESDEDEESSEEQSPDEEGDIIGMLSDDFTEDSSEGSSENTESSDSAPDGDKDAPAVEGLTEEMVLDGLDSLEIVDQEPESKDVTLGSILDDESAVVADVPTKKTESEGEPISESKKSTSKGPGKKDSPPKQNAKGTKKKEDAASVATDIDVNDILAALE